MIQVNAILEALKLSKVSSIMKKLQTILVNTYVNFTSQAVDCKSKNGLIVHSSNDSLVNCQIYTGLKSFAPQNLC